MATNTNTLILTLQIILMSTGVLFIAILLSPQISNFTSTWLPAIWSSLRPWLRRPYLYVIVNGIIIAIAAFSRLHHRQEHSNDHHPATGGEEFRQIHHNDRHLSTAASVDAYTCADPKDVHSVQAMEVSPLRIQVHEPPPALARTEDHGAAEIVYDETTTFGATETGGGDEVEEDETEAEVEKAIVVKEDVMEKVENGDFATVDGGYEEPEAVAWRSAQTSTTSLPAPLVRQGTSEIVSSFFESQIEKPPPAKLTLHRRPTRTAPEGGKAPRVAKPKRNETLESTWKEIIGGHHVPPTSHLRKSDTWDKHARQTTSSNLSTPSPVKKSETFADQTNSLSRDELNRRVEEFINKFNKDMRLQRQKSIQQFLEMINRAA